MKYYTFIILLFIQCNIFAQNIIPLKDEDDAIHTLGGKSTLLEPFATLDDVELTLLFPLATESQVILIDQDTQSVVYSQSFPSTRDLTVDLAVEGIDDGTYTLRVYAFGKWWIGEFELEDNE